ncbi:Spy/CpxP family protein refolding chaperone [Leptospira ilyithenensis]|uniref:Periplasmic heavy metal sensor n=1 Tax=Leptospira ilyithenensis TaxID=2484901 RepID=A0A4R9LP48_9LEPT|nr:periplasmic heavy metal sensor [Leptospira ilyithenensis]TGN07021.1 periplasmic heavy metal sensor [Leptospira ilyithenensis]
MKSILRTLLAASLVVALTFALSAHDEEHHGKEYSKDHGKHLEKMAKELGLTPEQKKQIEKVHSDSKQSREGYEKQKDILRKELHSLLSADNLDKSAIRSKMEEIFKLKVDSKMLWIDERIKTSEILTSEQRTKHKEIMKKLHADHGKKDKMKDKPGKRDKKRD